MPRVPFVDEDSEDPVLRRVFGHVEDSWGYVSHLYRTLGQSPVLLLEKWIDWSWTLRADCVSDRSLRELVHRPDGPAPTGSTTEWRATTPWPSSSG